MAVSPSPPTGEEWEIPCEELLRLYEGHGNVVGAEISATVVLVGTLADDLESRGIFFLENALNDALERISPLHAFKVCQSLSFFLATQTHK